MSLCNTFVSLCEVLFLATTTHEQTMVRIQRLLNSLTIVVAVYSMSWFLTIVALLVTQVRAQGCYGLSHLTLESKQLGNLNYSFITCFYFEILTFSIKYLMCLPTTQY